MRAAAEQPERELLLGYEEALGYAVSGVVRDKDGISAALVMAQLAAAERARGRTLEQRLDAIAERFGRHATEPVTLVLEGADGLERMRAIMDGVRAHPPGALLGNEVVAIEDLRDGVRLPPSDVLVIHADGARVVIRPSGTEPKLKAYLEVIVDGDRAAAAARARPAPRPRSRRCSRRASGRRAGRSPSGRRPWRRPGPCPSASRAPARPGRAPPAPRSSACCWISFAASSADCLPSWTLSARSSALFWRSVDFCCRSSTVFWASLLSESPQAARPNAAAASRSARTRRGAGMRRPSHARRRLSRRARRGAGRVRRGRPRRRPGRAARRPARAPAASRRAGSSRAGSRSAGRRRSSPPAARRSSA